MAGNHWAKTQRILTVLDYLHHYQKLSQHSGIKAIKGIAASLYELFWSIFCKFKDKHTNLGMHLYDALRWFCLRCSPSLLTVMNRMQSEYLSQWATCPFITPGLPLSLRLTLPLTSHSFNLRGSFISQKEKKKLCCEFITMLASELHQLRPKASHRDRRRMVKPRQTLSSLT